VFGRGGIAQTTGAVDATADLPGCEQSGNRPALQVEDLGLDVDFDAAGCTPGASFKGLSIWNIFCIFIHYS
jgi:hypothetical protein